MKFNGSERKILETLFDMGGGYVLDFSNRTMEEFFQEHFEIEIYDPKYDRENHSASKANRLRAIWEVEDDVTVGKIIYALTDYMELETLTNGTEIPQGKVALIQKAREIASKLVAGPNTVAFQAEAKTALEKSKVISDFTSLPLGGLPLDKKIYLLKILYSYYETILRAYRGEGLFYLTSDIDELNVSFKVLRRKMVELIESEPSFAELKDTNCYQGLIDPMTSLYSAPSLIDGVWEDGIVPYLIEFREIVADKDLFENNSKVHSFDKSVALFLEIIKAEVIEVRAFLKEQEELFDKKYSPRNDAHTQNEKATPEEDPVIRHEHRHIFENSIQEKEIAVSIDDRRNSQGGEHKFPYKLSRGTRWENLTIKFTGDDTVHILVQGKSHTTHYREMGLEGKGGKPSVLWAFLRVLAKYSGEIKATDPEAVDSYKKQKQLLSIALENYFGIDFDPFHPFATNKSYQAKFVILPPEGGFSFEKKTKQSPLEKPVKVDPFADLGAYMEEVAPSVAQKEAVPKDER